MSDESNIFKSMATIDRRLIYMLIFIIVLGIVFFPIGLPIAVSEGTRTWNSYLQDLDEDTIIWSAWQTGFAGYNELKPGIIATYREVIEHDAKMVIAFSQTAEFAVFEIVMGDEELGVRGLLTSVMEEYDYKYGEDYVCLGYVLVNEASTSALANNLHDVANVDYKGNSLAGTFYDDLNNAGDFDLIIDFSTGMQTTALINHWVMDYDVPMIEGAIGVNIPSYTPYLDTGHLKAMLQSTRGGAELEYLTGNPGPGIVSMDAFTLVHFLLIISIIIGNIGYFMWEKNQLDRARTSIQ
jgi:hypothetical protein